MTHSIDPDFAARVADYQKRAKKGLVFQAEGTVGGKKMRRQRPAFRARPIRMLFKLALILVAAKAVIFHVGTMVGFDPYAVVTSEGAGMGDQMMGLLFYPDPISIKVSEYLTVGQLLFASELREIL